jgi:predicted P-loop ATPase
MSAAEPAPRDFAAETSVMMKSGEWDEAEPEHFVCAYEQLYCHVYRVPCTIPASERTKARKAAGALLDRFDDPNEMAGYLRWTWGQGRRSKGRPIGWRLQFGGQVLDEYRVWYVETQGKQLDVADEPEPEPPSGQADADGEAPEWTKALLRSGGGAVRKCAANVVSILVQDERWAGVLAYDEFAGEVVSTRAPPWDESDAPASRGAGSWTDQDTTRACAWLSRHHNLDVSGAMLLEAVAVAAHRNSIHPVRDYLRALAWDGQGRIDEWLVDLCGAERGSYARIVGAKFLIAAVARVMRPGCKVDTTLVLEGAQGAKKSSALAALAGRDEWFLETGADLGTKDSYQALRRKWIVELSELDSLSRAEVSRVKAFLSARIDTYRPSYGRATIDFPRACVFVGTTNSEQYLKDETGGRRFWPVAIARVDLEGLRAVRDQLWAEARVRFEAGEAWHITDAQDEKLVAAEADARYVADPFEGAIARWLNDPSEAERRTQGVSTHQVCVFRGDPGGCSNVTRGPIPT